MREEGREEDPFYILCFLECFLGQFLMNDISFSKRPDFLQYFYKYTMRIMLRLQNPKQANLSATECHIYLTE